MVNELNLADDNALLGAVPEYLSITQMFKATPVAEGGDRFVYLEASNESVDIQGEVVLAKALSESADYYLKFGNLDIDHFTKIGAPNPAKGWGGIPNYDSFEIGRPVDVQVRDGRTFVKGQIYSGTGPAAEKANAFWSSLVDLNPPQRWYPSVGGQVLAKGIEFDPVSKSRRAVIKKVRWNNVAFSKTPVNPELMAVSTVPFGALAKSFSPIGFDWAKALEAGHVSDVAALTGGGALRIQSLDRGQIFNYWDFREKFAALWTKREIVSFKAANLVQAAQERFGLAADVAADYVERFLSDIKHGVSPYLGGKP